MSKIRTKKIVFFFFFSKINKYYFIILTIIWLFLLGGPFWVEISSNDNNNLNEVISYKYLELNFITRSTRSIMLKEGLIMVVMNPVWSLRTTRKKHIFNYVKKCVFWYASYFSDLIWLWSLWFWLVLKILRERLRKSKSIL